jgi:hypothetical protein
MPLKSALPICPLLCCLAAVKQINDITLDAEGIEDLQQQRKWALPVPLLLNINDLQQQRVAAASGGTSLSSR